MAARIIVVATGVLPEAERGASPQPLAAYGNDDDACLRDQSRSPPKGTHHAQNLSVAAAEAQVHPSPLGRVLPALDSSTCQDSRL